MYACSCPDCTRIRSHIDRIHGRNRAPAPPAPVVAPAAKVLKEFDVALPAAA